MKLNLLLLVSLLVVSSLLSGCGAGKRIKVNYETVQTVIIDEANRTKAAGEAFVGIAEAFFADRYQSPAYPLNQNDGAEPGPLRHHEEPPCENCGGPGYTLPEVDTPVEAVVYLGEDENGEVSPQRIEFKDAEEPGAECTVDNPCMETAEEHPSHKPTPKKKRFRYSENNSDFDPVNTVTAQIQNNVESGSGESLLLQYLLEEKRDLRQQRYVAERTKQFANLLDKMAEVMNKQAKHDTPE